MNHRKLTLAAAATLAVVTALPATADDWPQWGRDASKNMVSAEKGILLDFEPGMLAEDEESIDPDTTEGVRWIAKLGSQSYGNPTISDGRVYLGTNNEHARDPKYQGDRSIVLCLDEKTGDMIWQLNLPKLGAGKVSDWEYLGICSSPTVDGDRIYVVTNLCEVVCLDKNGMADGNDGPFTDEAAYLGGKGKPPIATGPKDADVLWVYDMREEMGVFPHNVTSSSVLQVGEIVYVNTSNGVDWSHVNIPSPRAPCLVALDRKTGKLLGEEASDISRRLMHCSWSSPGFGRVGEQDLVLFGAGDGFCYGFDPIPEKEEGDDDEDLPGILREVWRAECNAPSYRTKDGKPVRYATPPGPSEIIATPVFHEGRVYVAIGQDPEHGEGVGSLVCIDASKTGTMGYDDAVWTFEGIGRSISTVSVADGLVYAADYAGFLYCVDAKTGEEVWKHDTGAHIWGSTLVADGRVYIGNEDGVLTIMAAGREKKLLREAEFDGAIYGSPVIANGALYVQTQTHLFVIGGENK